MDGYDGELWTLVFSSSHNQASDGDQNKPHATAVGPGPGTLHRQILLPVLWRPSTPRQSETGQ